MLIRIVLATVVALPSLANGATIEVELLPECRPAAGWVTLGELARLRGNDAKAVSELARIPVMPSPGPRSNRVVTRQELIELISFRQGMDELEWSGATRTILLAHAPEAPSDPVAAPVTDKDLTTISRRIQGLVEDYLKKRSSGREWLVQCSLDRREATRLAPSIDSLSIAHRGQLRGQELTVVVKGNEGVEVPLNCHIEPRAVYFVAARRIRQGEILSPGDLRAEYSESTPPEGCVRRVEDAVGREVLRPVPLGEYIPLSILRKPVLVEQGKMVTVIARARGVRVTTVGRARDRGTEGDVVKVERPDDKEQYLAVVRGVNEVEVIASPAEVVAEARATPPTVSEKAGILERRFSPERIAAAKEGERR